ncbi:MAG: D-aminoacyl-tRNA deacylase [Spirochaetales bacterium]|nr:D-aminoacyl-tRNA deacylase [Spirochaetales bacterium]
MIVVIQRVNRASVTINQKEKKDIKKGLMILTGIGKDDDASDIDWIAKKIVNLRIFKDENDKMNLSVKDIDGEIMIVSQFTLFASTKKGNRPGFGDAALPDQAIPLYELFISKVTELSGKKPATGEFGADMDIDMINHGPVTIIIDSKNRQ